MLPEVFGVNAWVQSVADRLAAHRHPALALHLFSLTAPGLELVYAPSDLAQGRRNKDATTADQILGDVSAALSWLRACYSRSHPCGWLLLRGACRFSGGHVPGVEHA